MKKKPQLPRKLGKPNALRKSLLNNRRDIENNNENKQLSQCVFLGVLRLKPVPTTFSRTSVPTGSTSSISHRLRRNRNNNISKESNKNATKGVNLNKVISGKITKKNRDKVRACIKKNPLGTSKVLRICLTMNRAMMNPQSSNSEVVNVTDIPFHPATSFGVTQPTFNPVDELFNKLKQQLKHTDPPGCVDTSIFSSTVAKMNASKQLTSHGVKAKRKQSDNLTSLTDTNSDIIWINDDSDVNDSKLFPRHNKGPFLQATSTSETILTDIDAHQSSLTMHKTKSNLASMVDTVATKIKQITSSDLTQEIYEIDDHDSSGESTLQNKSESKQKEKAKSRRNRLIPAEIPLKYVNAPRLLRSELYQKAGKRSTSLESKDRTKDKSKPLRSEKVTFTIIKTSSEQNLNHKSATEITIKKQKSQDALSIETSTLGKERKKSSSPKNRNIQECTSDRWEITSSTQMDDDAGNVPDKSQKSTAKEQPISLKLKLTKTTRSSVAAAKATLSKEMHTDEIIFVEDNTQETSLEKLPVDHAAGQNTIQKSTSKTSKSINCSVPSVEILTNVSNLNKEDVIIIEDADDANTKYPALTKSPIQSKIPEDKIPVMKSFSVAEKHGNAVVPRILRSDLGSSSKLVNSGNSIPNKVGNGVAIIPPIKIIEEQLEKEKASAVGSEVSVESSNRELREKHAESALQNHEIFEKQNTFDGNPSKGNVSPRMIRLAEPNQFTVTKSSTDKSFAKGNYSAAIRSDMYTRASRHEQQPEQNKEKNKPMTIKPNEIIIKYAVQEVAIPDRVLRSEASKTVNNKEPHEKQVDVIDKMKDHSQPPINDEKHPRTLRSDAKKLEKPGSITQLQDEHDKMQEQAKGSTNLAAEENQTPRSNVIKVTEIYQTQLIQSGDSKVGSEKNVRALRSVSLPKSNEWHEVADKNQSIDVNIFHPKPSQISPQQNISSGLPGVPSRILRSTGEQQQLDASQKKKENLLVTEEQQSKLSDKSGIPQHECAPKQLENPPSRMLRSDQQKKHELTPVECLAKSESAKIVGNKEKMERLSRSVVADEEKRISGNSYKNGPEILPKVGKESAGITTKVARSRSSSPSKAKNINFDEIVVLSEKKSKKSKEVSVKISNKAAVTDSIKKTSVMEPATEVVVIIHEEPKSKSSPVVKNTSQEVENEKIQKGTEYSQRSLRSQKIEQQPVECPTPSEVLSSRSNPENREVSYKTIFEVDKAAATIKTAQDEIPFQSNPVKMSYDASELQRVATARVLRSEVKASDSVAKDYKAQSPATSGTQKVSFKNTPEVFVPDNTPKMNVSRQGKLKIKINDIIKDRSIGRNILKKGKLKAKDKIIKTMSQAFGKKQTLRTKVMPNIVEGAQDCIKPTDNRVEDTTYHVQTINSATKNSGIMIKDKTNEKKNKKKIVFATKTKEHFTNRDKKQQSYKVSNKKDKGTSKGKKCLPLALRRLLDGRISKKSLRSPERSVSNSDDSESNKENVLSKVENVVEKNIGPKTKKAQMKQKLLVRIKQTISKGNNKESKQIKSAKTRGKRNIQQKKLNVSPSGKKKSVKALFFKNNRPGKGDKVKTDKKAKKGKHLKKDVKKATKSVSKPDKENLVHNMENNNMTCAQIRKTAVIQSQNKGKKSNTKPDDINQIKSIDKKNKSNKNKKYVPGAMVQSSEKEVKKSEKRKRKDELSPAKKTRILDVPSVCITQSSGNNQQNTKAIKKKNIAPNKKIAKGKIKKNKISPNTEVTKGKKKKGGPKKKGEENSLDATSNTTDVKRPRVSLRKNKIHLQASKENLNAENELVKSSETLVESKVPDSICETNVCSVQKKATEVEKSVGSRKDASHQNSAAKKRQSKRICVVEQVEQGANRSSKKVYDVKQHIIVASCDSAVNTTITLPPGTSVEPIVMEDVKEEVPSRFNEFTNNNTPTKPSLSVFDFNESDMEVNTPSLLTLQNIREEIKEKHTSPKEHAQDVTYVVPEQGPNDVTYTLSSNPSQDLNKTYTTLNPVPNASSKDALSALNTNISVKEPESHVFSPPQKSTPKITKSTNKAKGPKLYSIIPSEEIVKKRVEKAEQLKAQKSQSINLTIEAEPQPAQKSQIQVRRPSQICDLSKLKHNQPASPSAVDALSSTIQVKTDKISPATSNSSTFEDLFNSPIKSPKKSPLKQTTILDMFAKMKQKNIIKAIFSHPEPVHQEPRMEPQTQLQQQQSTFSTLIRIPKETSVTPEVSAPMKESDSSDMPPPKMTTYGEDEDSDGESRMEWVPEEYAEYKFKYTAKKAMSYKPIFKCKVCLQMFPSYYKLNKHKRQHSQTDNPYKCQQCETSFNSVADLAAHIRVHKGKHPYTCKKCDTGFWTKEELDEHLSTHNLKKFKQPEKRFRCDVCLREFGRLYEVERHIRVHTGEKPFTCNICQKGYQQRHNLSKHLLIHLDVRPFHCEICGKAFGRSDVLDRHVLTHSVEKPVKCPHCDKDFIRQMQLKNHMKKRHAQFYDDDAVDGVAVLKGESSGGPTVPSAGEETVNLRSTDTGSVEPAISGTA